MILKNIFYALWKVFCVQFLSVTKKNFKKILVQGQSLYKALFYGKYFRQQGWRGKFQFILEGRNKVIQHQGQNPIFCFSPLIFFCLTVIIYLFSTQYIPILRMRPWKSTHCVNTHLPPSPALSSIQVYPCLLHLAGFKFLSLLSQSGKKKNMRRDTPPHISMSGTGIGLIHSPLRV